jgi:hypothetical protein
VSVGSPFAPHVSLGRLDKAHTKSRAKPIRQREVSKVSLSLIQK